MKALLTCAALSCAAFCALEGSSRLADDRSHRPRMGNVHFGGGPGWGAHRVEHPRLQQRFAAFRQ